MYLWLIWFVFRLIPLRCRRHGSEGCLSISAVIIYLTFLSKISLFMNPGTPILYLR